MIADVGMARFYRAVLWHWVPVPGRGLEPLFAGPKPAVLPIERPRKAVPVDGLDARHGSGIGPNAALPGSVRRPMGSLIKKRRKRMRKKKHKKMLRRTRHQRRK